MVPDPRVVGANELGVIPVLMYHRVLTRPTSDYDVSVRFFRRELARLYREGYRPILAADVASGEIDVAPGKSPVVLTFDDSSREQLAYRPSGKVSSDTAVGILMEFARTHPGFEPVATFYVNERPFGAGDWKDSLRDLDRRGFELGNHTAGHADLSALDARGVQRELALGERVITSAVPGADVRTLALPLGIFPARRELARSGSWSGEDYRHLGVFLVGAEPAPSPFAKSFDPLAIPRIRSSPWKGGEPNYGSAFWLEYLADHPEERYVSDGDPDSVSFPRALRSQLDPAFDAISRPYHS